MPTDNRLTVPTWEMRLIPPPQLPDVPALGEATQFMPQLIPPTYAGPRWISPAPLAEALQRVNITEVPVIPALTGRTFAPPQVTPSTGQGQQLSPQDLQALLSALGLGNYMGAVQEAAQQFADMISRIIGGLTGSISQVPGVTPPYSATPPYGTAPPYGVTPPYGITPPYGTVPYGTTPSLPLGGTPRGGSGFGDIEGIISQGVAQRQSPGDIARAVADYLRSIGYNISPEMIGNLERTIADLLARGATPDVIARVVGDMISRIALPVVAPPTMPTEVAATPVELRPPQPTIPTEITPRPAAPPVTTEDLTRLFRQAAMMPLEEGTQWLANQLSNLGISIPPEMIRDLLLALQRGEYTPEEMARAWSQWFLPGAQITGAQFPLEPVVTPPTMPTEVATTPIELRPPQPTIPTETIPHIATPPVTTEDLTRLFRQAATMPFEEGVQWLADQLRNLGIGVPPEMVRDLLLALQRGEYTPEEMARAWSQWFPPVGEQAALAIPPIGGPPVTPSIPPTVVPPGAQVIGAQFPPEAEAEEPQARPVGIGRTTVPSYDELRNAIYEMLARHVAPLSTYWGREAGTENLLADAILDWLRGEGQAYLLGVGVTPEMAEGAVTPILQALTSPLPVAGSVERQHAISLDNILRSIADALATASLMGGNTFSVPLPQVQMPTPIPAAPPSTTQPSVPAPAPAPVAPPTTTQPSTPTPAPIPVTPPATPQTAQLPFDFAPLYNNIILNLSQVVPLPEAFRIANAVEELWNQVIQYMPFAPAGYQTPRYILTLFVNRLASLFPVSNTPISEALWRTVNQYIGDIITSGRTFV